jgi:hypothetical protein
VTRQTRYYAVRRVNPFEGVLQVVETPLGRAYSPNGEVWQIQVLAERPDHTWRSLSHAPPIRQFFNFGLWDAEGGLHKIPANPVMDIGGMTSAARETCDTLETLADRIPFALTDRYECWCTDHLGQPIALLATCEDPALVDDLRVTPWHASRASDRGFVSASLSRRGIPDRDNQGPRQHAARLERLVRQSGPQRRWYERLENGRGLPLKPRGDDQTLPAVHFPPLGLKTDWASEEDREYVSDYIAWLAPRLLMLQHLSDSERQDLEQIACRQAEELATGFRLLPRVIDQRAIEAARVEARLRRASR